MDRGETGRYEVTTIGGEKVRAFIPLPLPPVPPLVLDGPLLQALEAANLALGRLDGVTTLLTRQVPLPLSLRTQGGGSLITDRRNAVLAYRFIATRAGPGAGSPPRRHR